MISNVIFSPWWALHGNLQKACRMEIASWLQLLLSEEWAVLGELEILTHVSCCSIISHAIGAFAAFYIALPFTSYPHGCGVRGSHHVTACGRIMHETHCLGLRAPGQCQLHRPWVGPDGSQLQRHSSRPDAETGAANLAGQGPAGALAVRRAAHLASRSVSRPATGRAQQGPALNHGVRAARPSLAGSPCAWFDFGPQSICPAHDPGRFVAQPP